MLPVFRGCLQRCYTERLRTEDVRNGLNAAVWVPRKASEEIRRLRRAEVVKEEERVELVCLGITKRTTKQHTSSLECWLWTEDLCDGADHVLSKAWRRVGGWGIKQLDPPWPEVDLVSKSRFPGF